MEKKITKTRTKTQKENQKLKKTQTLIIYYMAYCQERQWPLPLPEALFALCSFAYKNHSSHLDF